MTRFVRFSRACPLWFVLIGPPRVSTSKASVGTGPYPLLNDAARLARSNMARQSALESPQRGRNSPHRPPIAHGPGRGGGTACNLPTCEPDGGNPQADDTTPMYHAFPSLWGPRSPCEQPSVFTLPGTRRVQALRSTGRRKRHAICSRFREPTFTELFMEKSSKPSILGQEWSGAGPRFHGDSVRACTGVITASSVRTRRRRQLSCRSARSASVYLHRHIRQPSAILIS